jgi:hypothetical protein
LLRSVHPNNAWTCLRLDLRQNNQPAGNVKSGLYQCGSHSRPFIKICSFHSSTATSDATLLSIISLTVRPRC